MKTHTFDTTGEAYDATQYRNDIKVGDLLIIESERVIGVAYTWPIAVTAKHGNLHNIAMSSTIQDVAQGEKQAEALVKGYFEAQQEAIMRGYDLSEPHAQARIDDLNQDIQYKINDLTRESLDSDQESEIREDAAALMKDRDALERALYHQQNRLNPEDDPTTREQEEQQAQAEASISHNFGDCGRSI